MDNRFNTIAGWVLAGGIVLLGASLVTGEYFKAERPEHMGYPIAGVVEEGDSGGAPQDPPVAAVLQTADAAAGEAVFRRCTACHNADQGGANQLGPNLWAVVGEPIAQGRGGYAFSEALRSHGGTWTFENLYEWLKSPRNFAPGTKMTFAGISDPQDRANVIAYLNAHGSNVPLPPPPQAGPQAPQAEGAAPDTDANTTAPATDAPGSNPRVGGEAQNQTIGNSQ